MGRVTAVSIGERMQLAMGVRMMETGISKTPVARIEVQSDRITGDFIGDDAHHGGPDQVVYVYLAEDYAWWARELGSGVDVGHGCFGENLVIEGFAEHGFRIGDRLVFPECTLEVTAPRIPCSTLSNHIGVLDLVKQFVDAGRPGFYARVIRAGRIGVDEDVVLEPAPPEHVRLSEVYDAWYARPHDTAFLERALRSPLAVRTRDKFVSWLDESGK